MNRAYTLPLPGLDLTDETAEGVDALWAQLSAVHATPAYKALRMEWTGMEMRAALALLGARDGDSLTERRTLRSVATLPDAAMTLLGSLAVRAKKRAKDGMREREGFETADEARQAQRAGEYFSAMCGLPGWPRFAGFLTAFAWACAWTLAWCKPDDAPMYRGARDQIVKLLTDVQSAIDRGVDATVWLEKAAREQTEE